MVAPASWRHFERPANGLDSEQFTSAPKTREMISLESGGWVSKEWDEAIVRRRSCRRGDRMIAAMKRREFISLLGGAAAAWPLAARAQQPFKAPIIGFLGASTSAAWSAWTSAFVRRLGELGWID